MNILLLECRSFTFSVDLALPEVYNTAGCEEFVFFVTFGLSGWRVEPATSAWGLQALAAARTRTPDKNVCTDLK